MRLKKNQFLNIIFENQLKNNSFILLNLSWHNFILHVLIKIFLTFVLKIGGLILHVVKLMHEKVDLLMLGVHGLYGVPEWSGHKIEQICLEVFK